MTLAVIRALALSDQFHLAKHHTTEVNDDLGAVPGKRNIMHSYMFGTRVVFE